MIYTYELAVDLKKLDLNVADSVKFAYNITLPGIFNPMGTVGSNMTVNGPHGPITFTVTSVSPIPRTPGNPNAQDISNPTDFWGEYTLVKK